MLDRTFAALADPTRRAIVKRLTRGDATVTELAAPFAMSLPAVLKHIGVLEEAGLTRCTKEGRARVCALDGRAFDRATDWIDKRRAVWERRLRALDRMLGEES
jgi:DNA-binding transcriptional ArsR family regulator